MCSYADHIHKCFKKGQRNNMNTSDSVNNAMGVISSLYLFKEMGKCKEKLRNHNHFFSHLEILEGATVNIPKIIRSNFVINFNNTSHKVLGFLIPASFNELYLVLQNIPLHDCNFFT